MNTARSHKGSTRVLALIASVTLVAVLLGGTAMAANHNGHDEERPTADVAALYMLQSDFHLAASTKNIELLMSLFAEDGTFVGPGNVTYVGRAAVGKGFLTTGAYQPTNDWAGLAPSYRTKIEVLSSHRATMYFECDYVDRTTLQVKAQLTANTTEVRRNGTWLFKSFSGGPAPKL